jgi:hypothetical protein
MHDLGYADAYYYRGLAEYKLGNYPLAEQNLRHAIHYSSSYKREAQVICNEIERLRLSSMLSVSNFCILTPPDFSSYEKEVQTICNEIERLRLSSMPPVVMPPVKKVKWGCFG